MHFGANNVCKTVSRAKWTQKAEERGLVYCEENQCILVPTVCRNVSRISRVPARAAAPGGAQNVASSTQEAEPQFPLDMEPTGAGPLSTPNAPGSFAQVAGGGSGLDGLPGATPGGSTLFPPGGGGTGGPGVGPGVVPSLPPGSVKPPVIPPVVPGVPEPQTWALMLGGLLAVGFMAGRRKKA